jgi:nicotinamide mononucleotide transporter
VTWLDLGVELPAWVPSPVEWAGFLTGAACVWLVVKRHVLNFPLGLASCACFIVVFAQQRLYGEAGLQVFFIALGFHGWYLWLRGGPGHTALNVTRVPGREAATVAAATAAATAALWGFLTWVNGSAPFLDALVTALSLAAQWLLNRKRVETWPVWMAVDVLTVYLSLTRGLYLVAALYVIFFGMCVVGLAEWRRAMAAAGVPCKDGGGGSNPA